MRDSHKESSPRSVLGHLAFNNPNCVLRKLFILTNGLSWVFHFREEELTNTSSKAVPAKIEETDRGLWGFPGASVQPTGVLQWAGAELLGR